MNDQAPLTRYIVRVRFRDTDLMGVVHHATYLEYLEAGRVEYLRRRGMDYVEWTRRGVHLAVAEVHVRYRKSARFDDRIVVETRLAELGLQGVETVVTGGEPARAIVELADERKADLIVLGAHDGGLVSRLFEGSVDDAVSHRAHTDVLIVH